MNHANKLWLLPFGNYLPNCWGIWSIAKLKHIVLTEWKFDSELHHRIQFSELLIAILYYNRVLGPKFVPLILFDDIQIDFRVFLYLDSTNEILQISTLWCYVTPEAIFYGKLRLVQSCYYSIFLQCTCYYRPIRQGNGVQYVKYNFSTRITFIQSKKADCIYAWV